MARQKPRSKYFYPNEVSKFERNVNTILACLILSYGLLGMVCDDIYIPGRYTRGFHFHGPPMYIVFTAFLCFVAYLLAVIVDHYDRRNNERRYVTFRKVIKNLGYILFFVALIVDLVFYKLITR